MHLPLILKKYIEIFNEASSWKALKQAYGNFKIAKRLLNLARLRGDEAQIMLLSDLIISGRCLLGNFDGMRVELEKSFDRADVQYDHSEIPTLVQSYREKRFRLHALQIEAIPNNCVASPVTSQNLTGSNTQICNGVSSPVAMKDGIRRNRELAFETGLPGMMSDIRRLRKTYNFLLSQLDVNVSREAALVREMKKIFQQNWRTRFRGWQKREVLAEALSKRARVLWEEIERYEQQIYPPSAYKASSPVERFNGDILSIDSWTGFALGSRMSLPIGLRR
jgi:hypothetical protein